MDYNRFITIIFQICSINSVFYDYKILYNKSTYDIVYYITKDSNSNPNSDNNITS